MRAFHLLILGALLVTPSHRLECHEIVVVPSYIETQEGNSALSPLSTGLAPARFQQVYSSSIFASYTQGCYIDALGFRGDVASPSFLTVVTNMEISLSSTLAGVDNLSALFDQNVASDNQIVAGREPHLLSGGGGTPVNPWGIVFVFETNGFYYNPSAGNLLLDIRTYSGARAGALDAVNDPADGISSVFAYGATMPDSGVLDTRGLATIFSVRPIPEPSSVVMLLTGLIVMGILARKKFRKS